MSARHQTQALLLVATLVAMSACGEVKLVPPDYDALDGFDSGIGEVSPSVDATPVADSGSPPSDAGVGDTATADGQADDAAAQDVVKAVDTGPVDAESPPDSGTPDGGSTPDVPPECLEAADCTGKVGPAGTCQDIVCTAGKCDLVNSQAGKFCGFECGGSGAKISYRKSICKAGKCEPQGDPIACVPDQTCLITSCAADEGCQYKADDKKCADNNPCTSSECTMDKGCVWSVKTGPCDDGDECTKEDKCLGGTCKGGYNKCACQGDANCKTINPCLPATCGPGKFCINQAKVGATCDDGDSCTSADACDKDGGCHGKSTNCDDKIACTKDSCDPASGCAHSPDSSLCDDGNPCTEGLCGKSGCKSTDKGGSACDDGDACTVGDTCAGPKCSGKAGPPCASPGPCKTSACDPLTGKCVAKPLVDGVACDDGNACTKVDACKSGICGDGKPPCDDDEPCTMDTCDPAKGCTHQLNQSGPCDDGDPCTKGDQCVGGKCKPGPASACDDGNPCTLDTCDDKGACAHPPVIGGKPCANDKKMCQGGKCLAVTAPKGMTWIPATTFKMGCNAKVDNKCKAHEKPQHDVTLSSYYIELKEVTAGAYKLCVLATKCSPAKSGVSHATYNTPKSTHPINWVTWKQAVKFCAVKGSRLCTEAEWEYAARGQTGAKYPWGNNSPTCSLAAASGCGGPGPKATGSKPKGASPFGLLDMAGNVREWTADWYGATWYGTKGASAPDPKGPASGKTRVIRGGYYDSNASQLRASDRAFIAPTLSSATVGFRCCRSIKN